MKCPLEDPKFFGVMCLSDLVVEGEGPDEVATCPKCGAVWTMDGKEDIYGDRASDSL